ncbi:hypothetical protein GLYMA_14G187650v4 [Glycine max]|nr:hypothetical protein GLYMA_14G187650v4 [Glycine max]KAH1095226.1 hypothetical protein GYH30_040492 [Glycine max]
MWLLPCLIVSISHIIVLLNLVLPSFLTLQKTFLSFLLVSYQVPTQPYGCLRTVMLVTSKFQRGNSYTLHSACNFGHNKHYIPIDGGGRIHTTIRPLMLN